MAKGSIKVDESSRGTNPACNSGGHPGKSMPTCAIPGPTSSGGPVSLRKALTKKDVRGSDATGAAGSVR